MTLARTVPAKSAHRQIRGYLILLAAICSWASTAIFIVYLLTRHPLAPLTLAFWRDFFVTVSLAGLLFARRGRLPAFTRRDLPFFLVYGGIGLASFNIIWTYSISLNGAAVGTVLAYTAPAYVAVAARWLFKERLTLVKLLALMLSLAGCTFVSGAHDPSAWAVRPAGIALGLVSGLGFATFSLFGKWAAGRYDPWKTTFYGFAFASVFLAFTQRPDTAFSLGSDGLGWLLLFALGAGPTLGGYGLYTVSLTYLPAGVASMFATLEPALTAAMAFVLLGEHMTLAQVLGSALILGAVVLLARSEPR